MTPRLDTPHVAADFAVAQVTVSDTLLAFLMSQAPASYRNIIGVPPYHVTRQSLELPPGASRNPAGSLDRAV